MYSLYLTEASGNGDFVIYNAEGEEVYSLPAPEGYDPDVWATCRYPDLYSGAYTPDGPSRNAVGSAGG
jgi:hypothetical protein